MGDGGGGQQQQHQHQRSLSDILSSALPSSHPHKYIVHYLLSPPTKHPSLYSNQQPFKPPKSTKPSSSRTTVTTCQHHLLLLSHNSKFIYALEILIYHQSHSSPIIYVSKADTTGYSPSSITRPITTAFLQYLLQRTGGAGVIQLFARSQPQYIFPCSASNGKKRILDDAQLIKWWLRVLSPLRGQGKVYIPGVDKLKIKSYYPPSEGKWECEPPGMDEGSMEGGVAEERLAKDVIPIFPDDPKARFLDDLKGDGQLDTITCRQFWELMEHRQECSSGRLVGFISTKIETPTTIDPTNPIDNSTKSIEKIKDDGTKANDKNKAIGSNDGMMVDEKNFKRAFEMLLNGEYSSDEITVAATTRWLEAISAIIPGEQNERWGFELVPCGKEDKNGDEGGNKKRGAEPVNMLGGSLVRKKPKT